MYASFRLLLKLTHDRRGAVSLIFAFAMIMIGVAIGAAIDYTRAVNYRGEMQYALDSAALAMAPSIGDVPDKDLQAKALEVFSARFPAPFTSVQATKLVRGVKLTAIGSIETTMMKLGRVDSVSVSASSRAERAVRKIEVALVIDSSGSMKGSKLSETKKAAEALITLLKNSESANDITMAIVPFDSQVNLSNGPNKANWLYWEPLIKHARDQYNYTLDKKTIQPMWPGCVVDRSEPHDADDSAPGIEDASTSYIPWVCDSSGADPRNPPTLVPLLSLTSNWSTLSAKAQSIVAGDNSSTNLTIGLAWGMAALSPQEPLIQAEPFGPQVAKYLIILTDGLNQKNRFGHTTAQMDVRTQAACDEAKGKGVTLFSVRVIAGNEALLKGCASNPAHYYSINNATELTTAFQDIGRNITRLRLTQ